jgi:hypothetical protein
VIAALLLSAIAAICAGLALQYAWVFYAGVRRRHSERFTEISIFGKSADILALNDADVYASWRLTRVNLTVSLVCLAGASGITYAMH